MTTIGFDDLVEAAGRDLGYSDWIVIDQRRIDQFADATDDHQWIHVDPSARRGGPFGGTIAHGDLILSAAGARLGELLTVDGASQIVNYGLDKARFPAPVPAGARVRAHARITGVTAIGDGAGFQVCARVTAESEGAVKPVCIADVQVRYLR